MKKPFVLLALSLVVFVLDGKDGLSQAYVSSPKVYTIEITAKSPRLTQNYSKSISVGIRLSNGSILSVLVPEEEIANKQLRKFTIPPDLTIASCSFTWTLGNMVGLFFRPGTLKDSISGDCLVDSASNQIIVDAGEFALYHFSVSIDAKALSRFDSMYLSLAAHPKCDNEVMIPLSTTLIQGSVDNEVLMRTSLEVLCPVAPTLEVQFLNLKNDGSVVEEFHNYALDETILY